MHNIEVFLLLGVLSKCEKRFIMADCCDMCSYYTYDDEYECYVCDMDLDEDDLVKFLQGNTKECPFFQSGDEYKVVRHQM